MHSHNLNLKPFIYTLHIRVRIRVMVFSTTLAIISAKSWWSVLLENETGVLGESHRPARSN